jgi:hypothetical protein
MNAVPVLERDALRVIFWSGLGSQSEQSFDLRLVVVSTGLTPNEMASD